MECDLLELLERAEGRGHLFKKDAAAAINVKVGEVNRMWAGSPTRPRREMKLWEAGVFATLLGYELKLRPKDQED